MALSLLKRLMTSGDDADAGTREDDLVQTASRLREGDVFLVSYPRSGNTWLRNIVAHILYDESRIRSLKDLDWLVPDIYHGLPPRDDTTLVVKSHDTFSNRLFKRKHPYDRIVYVARHPFDVACSYHHYLHTINPDEWSGPLDDFVEAFTKGAVWPGSWHEHALSWQVAQKHREMIVLRYEDLRRRSLPEIQRLGRFLGRDLDKEQAARVSQRCSRENMVALEKKGSLVRDDYAFIRRSDQKRSTKEDLTDAHRAVNEHRCGEAIRTLGYADAPTDAV